MQAAAVRITRLEMVSNVHKPAPTSNGLPAAAATTCTNGVATAKSTVVVVGDENQATAATGLQTKGRKMAKRVHRNGIVNGCSMEHGSLHLSPSPPPPSHVPAPQALPPALIHAHNKTTTRDKATPPPRLPTTLSSNQTKTRGSHSNEQGSSSTTSLGDQSQHRRLVCPELAINYTGTLMSHRAGQLVGGQRDLEARFSNITRKLRQKQLRGVLSHVRKQLHFQDETTSSSGADKHHKVGDLAGSLGSSKSDSLSSVASSSDAQSDKTEPMDTSEVEQGLTHHQLPIQVDGASDERSSSISRIEDQPVAGSNQGEGLQPLYPTGGVNKDDVFRDEGASLVLKSTLGRSAMESEDDTGCLDGSVKCIEQQLLGLRRMMDDDVTDSSSDEEEEAPQITR